MIFKLQLKLIAYFIKLLDLTFRYQFNGVNHIEFAKTRHKSGLYLLALWHNNAIAGIMSHENQNLTPLTSQSKDGEIVNYVASKFGLQCIRGSSNTGALAAIREILGALKHNHNVAITVDGPKGPLHEVKPGIVDIASKTGIPIVPLAPIASKNWVLKKTWDKTRIPKPFSKVIVQYGEPILIPQDIKGEDKQIYLDKVRQAILDVENAALSKIV